MKLKFICLLLFIFFSQMINAGNLPIYVRPLENGNLIFGGVNTYNFSFDISDVCLNSIFSYSGNFQTSLKTADFFVNVTTPLSISENPKFICVYRDSGLWTTLEISNGYFDKLYADSLNITN